MHAPLSVWKTRQVPQYDRPIDRDRSCGFSRKRHSSVIGNCGDGMCDRDETAAFDVSEKAGTP
jgi:hypothetical protein